MAIVDEGASGYSPEPGGRAFSTLKNVACRYVKLPDDEEALEIAASAINGAILRLNGRAWNWMLTTQTITLEADTALYTLAARFKAPRHLKLLDSNSKERQSISWMEQKEFDWRFPRRDTSGSPSAYTIYNALDTGQLELNKPASSSFISTYPSMTLRYYHRLPKLVGSDGRITDAPSEVEEFVLWQARLELAATFNPKLSRDARKERDDLWDGLIRDDNSTDEYDFTEY